MHYKTLSLKTIITLKVKKHSENTNSNLEYFVQERGYDLDNLQDIPNHMVTPKKYDLSRAK